MESAELIQQFIKKLKLLKAEIAKIIVGHEPVIEEVITVLIAGGHILLEGVPGIGKTILVKTLAQCLNLKFSRIQFTPDLMPADITGTNLIVEGEDGRKQFQFQPGAIFGNVILADEINRATPKTQSALLEAMQEYAVTVSGIRHPLEQPFLVLATQNPIEMAGTYPLPEAQLDRFFYKILIASPSEAELEEVMERTTTGKEVVIEQVLSGQDILHLRRLVREVPVAQHLKNYIARIVRATHPEAKGNNDLVSRYIRYGASPRGAQSLMLGAKVHALLQGRYHLAAEDIKAVALSALRHRLILNFAAEAENIKADTIIKNLLESIPELPPKIEKILNS